MPKIEDCLAERVGFELPKSFSVRWVEQAGEARLFINFAHQQRCRLIASMSNSPSRLFRVLDLGDDDSLNVEPRLFTLAHQFAQVVRDLA
jgi:hypothetical protein